MTAAIPAATRCTGGIAEGTKGRKENGRQVAKDIGHTHATLCPIGRGYRVSDGVLEGEDLGKMPGFKGYTRSEAQGIRRGADGEGKRKKKNDSPGR